MSKRPAAAKPETGKEVVKEVRKVVKKFSRNHILHQIRKGNIHHAVVFLIALIAAFAFRSEGALSTAVLYIFAFNGKVSGRMDGNVAMRNGRMRGFVVPALVQNSYTMTQRGLFSQYSSNYAGLTPGEIDAWTNFSYQHSNRFGQTFSVSGKEAYIALNVNLVMVGSAPITSPPVLVGVTGIVTLAITATSPNLLSLAFTATPTDANAAHLVFATKPLGNGITRPSQSAYRLIDIIPPATASPYAAGATYVAKFGNLIATDKVFVKLVAIDINTGQSTPSVAAFDVIA